MLGYLNAPAPGQYIVKGVCDFTPGSFDIDSLSLDNENVYGIVVASPARLAVK
jgi:hypothetical protein